MTEGWAIGLLVGLFILLMAAVVLSLHPATPSNGHKRSTAPTGYDCSPSQCTPSDGPLELGGGDEFQPVPEAR